MNFSANILGLDNAATPFGIKAMESLQELNPNKERASNAQVMFLCLHASGLTLIPITIIGDTQPEQNEFFYVMLSSSTGVSISKSLGTGTITNDD